MLKELLKKLFQQSQLAIQDLWQELYLQLLVEAHNLLLTRLLEVQLYCLLTQPMKVPNILVTFLSLFTALTIRLIYIMARLFLTLLNNPKKWFNLDDLIEMLSRYYLNYQIVGELNFFSQKTQAYLKH